MSRTIIKIENLSKKYSIAHKNPGSDGLRHVLENALSVLPRAVASLLRAKQLSSERNGAAPSARRRQSSKEDFWALKNLSLEIEQGEVLGIVGRNGAGKSTLLKVLGRITEPTAGRVIIGGAIASLLEVGTGFHPELTGRENVFLNGSILGMSFREIRRKFDEIVAFAEVEQFLDTPVKRYSSGMYVRLAFSVAAHLESEIMLVDEVLAVGDAQFQKKCLGKIKEVSSHSGRTVLFVSHNAGVVSSLCTRAVLLRRGELVTTGPVRDVLELYTSEAARETVDFDPDPSKPCITKVTVDQARLAQGDLAMEISFSSPFPLNPPIVGVIVATTLGVPIFATDPLMHPEDFERKRLYSGVARVLVPNLPLHPGDYRASVFLAEQGAPYDFRRDVLAFEFVPRKPIAAKCSPVETIGPLIVQARWELDGGDERPILPCRELSINAGCSR